MLDSLQQPWLYGIESTSYIWGNIWISHSCNLTALAHFQPQLALKLRHRHIVAKYLVAFISQRVPGSRDFPSLNLLTTNFNSHFDIDQPNQEAVYCLDYHLFINTKTWSTIITRKWQTTPSSRSPNSRSFFKRSLYQSLATKQILLQDYKNPRRRQLLKLQVCFNRKMRHKNFEADAP